MKYVQSHKDLSKDSLLATAKVLIEAEIPFAFKSFRKKWWRITYKGTDKTEKEIVDRILNPSKYK